ncbi:MAG: hypothetical protein LBV40_08115 [Methanomicrobiales archaeon]|jgi:hypothetical protein|nr:hypothetical protein [Methanomicrobiales archaeon]
MTENVILEIVGYKNMECSPFPCDSDRSCGLYDCAPTNALLPAVDALKKELHAEFGDAVKVTLTLLDDGVPDYIKNIYERDHPALPMILVQGVPIDRKSVV